MDRKGCYEVTQLQAAKFGFLLMQPPFFFGGGGWFARYMLHLVKKNVVSLV